MGSITNLDSQADITALTGAVLLPQGSTLTLQTVRLLQASNYTPVTGATISISGNTFEVSGFTPLSSTGHYVVVARLSGSPGGQRVRLDITAEY